MRRLLTTATFVGGLCAVPWVRRRLLRFGASADEVDARLDGDELLGDADLVATRAISIDAPAERVWPWVVQIGQGRGGFYSYDTLENLAGSQIHSAAAIVPEWQDVRVGDVVRLHPQLAVEVALVDAAAHVRHSQRGDDAQRVAAAVRLHVGVRPARHSRRWDAARRARALPLYDEGREARRRTGCGRELRHDAPHAARHPRASRTVPRTAPRDRHAGLVSVLDPARRGRACRARERCGLRGALRVRPPGAAEGALPLRARGRYRRRPLRHRGHTHPRRPRASERGVVGEGPVGSRLLGRFRVFRYEIRRWRNGTIPDVDDAIESPVKVTDDADTTAHVLDDVARVPTPVWGRDEYRTGDMWNSNSVVSWLLARAQLLDKAGAPPFGGRGTGWDAGFRVAAEKGLAGGVLNGAARSLRRVDHGPAKRA